MMGAIADYVVDLLAEILGETPEREKRFHWAVGDVSPKTGRAVLVPFDAVWEQRCLIVEIDEDQHRRPVKFWDKPDRLTVSGVHRGEQRQLYDMRKRSAARRHGYVVIEIPWERRPIPAKRDPLADIDRLRRVLEAAQVDLG